MEWRYLLEKRIKARRQILFSKEDEEILSLMILINEQPRKAVILWALELAEETVKVLEKKYPSEKRSRTALELTRKWASGEVKMLVAKRAILDCHAAAKEIISPADVAKYHAVGQACGTVHANGHAIGYPIYDLTSMIREKGLDNCDEIIHDRIGIYIKKLLYWRDNYMEGSYQWAEFIRNCN